MSGAWCSRWYAGLTITRPSGPPAGTPPAALAAARDTLGGAVTAAGRLPGPTGTGLLEAARAAFTHGLDQAALAAAITLALAAPACAVFFRGVRVESPAAVTAAPQPEAQEQFAA